MRLRTVRMLLSGVFAVTLAACSASNQADAPRPFVEARPSTVRLLVQNRNFSDARLYAESRGERTTLGTVTGKRDAEFILDWPAHDPLQIIIDMIAGPRCTTQEMLVDPGDTLELQIAVVFSDTTCRQG
jgi:hypothetical protein